MCAAMVLGRLCLSIVCMVRQRRRRGKTHKTSVLHRLSKIEGSGGSGVAPQCYGGLTLPGRGAVRGKWSCMAMSTAGLGCTRTFFVPKHKLTVYST